MVGQLIWPLGKEPVAIDITGNVERGVYLARASGCIAYHTSFNEGGAPLAGGEKLETPFGTFYSANLTTDQEFGIGSWTIEEFAIAVRQGISLRRRRLLPSLYISVLCDFH